MNQYQTKNAAEWIDGYMVPRPNESTEAAFERARLETVQAYEEYIRTVKCLSFEEFKGCFPKYKE